MIGVDIGATNILIGLIEDDKVVHRIHQPIVPPSNPGAIATQVCQAIQSLSDSVPETVGIAVAGSVDVSSGIVLRAQNLNWNDVPLAAIIAEQLHCKVVVENDVTAAAWGEFKFGAGRNSDSMFAVWIGTGIGGGLIFNGAIWRGPFGTAGEFGMSISEWNPLAQRRTLETFASRSGLQDVTNIPTLDTASITSAYNDKESEICGAIDEGASRVGTAIANVITLLSLDTVVLGGGIVEALGQPYIEQIRAQFERDVFPQRCHDCVFIQTQLGPDAGLLGVADISLH